MEEIRIVKNEDGYTVYQGERFADRLCWDEMLSQVVHLTHPSINKAHYSMTTTDEFIARQRYRSARRQSIFDNQQEDQSDDK